MDLFRRLAGLLGHKKQAAAVERNSVLPITQEAQGDREPRQGKLEASVPVPQSPGKTPEVHLVVDDFPNASDIVRQICTETLDARSHRYEAIDLAKSPRWNALKTEGPELQAAVAWAAYRGEQDRNSPYYWRSLDHGEPRRAIFTQSLRRNLPFKSEQLLYLLSDWLKHDLSSLRDYSGRALLGAVEKLARRQTLPLEMCEVLARIRGMLPRGFTHEEAAKQSDRIDRILNPEMVEPVTLPSGPFADELSRWAAPLTAAERLHWHDLAMACAKAADRSRPSRRWLKTAGERIGSIGPVKFAELLVELMNRYTPDPSVHDESRGMMRALLWTTPLVERGSLAGDVGRFAEKLYTTTGGWGEQTNKLFNAAVMVLSEMAGEPRAAAELFRLRAKVKQHGTRKQIDELIEELAQKSSTTVGALEDFSLPTFDLDPASRLSVAFGEARVELVVAADGIVQRWTNAAAKAVKSPPAEVRAEFGEELAEFRQQAKDIDAARHLQVARLEQSWAEERSWTYSDWETHFLRHPLRRPVVAALIWQIGDMAVMPDAGTLKDVSGEACSFAPSDRVRLWHPVESEPEAVLAWRARIIELGLTQPIKQAHREIYVLTDAERATRIYSNRFAAHILRQYQFRALCQARGWRCSLMGNWDGWEMPSRTLPNGPMTVEYQVKVVAEDQPSSAAAPLHIASDQVRFLDWERQSVALEEIAPIVFSEVMRDVDLFVAVTSVANDPNWTDGGPNGRHGGYWQEWAFGELGQTAVMRRELATWLVPKLSIADKLGITDKFLVVQGKRQKYAIHFGSSNIQILPSNRYLCIVPDRAPKEAQDIKLPFEGDSLFSAILSKAFLLVDESKIKDKTILRQL